MAWAVHPLFLSSDCLHVLSTELVTSLTIWVTSCFPKISLMGALSLDNFSHDELLLVVFPLYDFQPIPTQLLLLAQLCMYLHTCELQDS